ncbi:unnamed protein product [Sphacelaria rigidula]
MMRHRGMEEGCDTTLMLGGAGDAGKPRFGQRRVQARPTRALANGRHGGSAADGGGWTVRH